MFSLPSPLHKVEHPLLVNHGVKMWLKRDDLIHPEISGNKWRKLKYNFAYAQENGFSEIVTLGGAYSNHIAAVAAAASHFGLKSVGIIRGDELNDQSNLTLRKAHNQGMKLEFKSREEYRNLKSDISPIMDKYSESYFIPEGGTNNLAIQGASEIIEEIEIDFDQIITSIGTGGTMAGLVMGLQGEKEVLGMSALKGKFIESEFKELFTFYGIPHKNYNISFDHHFGGYGKTSASLIHFINNISKELNVLFDPIYTGKALFGVWEMIASGKLDDQTLVFLHTGGLQGVAGFNQKNTQKIHI